MREWRLTSDDVSEDTTYPLLCLFCDHLKGSFALYHLFAVILAGQRIKQQGSCTSQGNLT